MMWGDNICCFLVPKKDQRGGFHFDQEAVNLVLSHKCTWTGIAKASELKTR